MPILSLLSGPKFHDAAFIIPWLAPVPLFFLLWAAFNRILLAMERSRLIGGLTLAAALLNLVLNILLVPHFQERGSALAMVLTMACLMTVTGVAVRAWLWIDWRGLMGRRLAILFLAVWFGLWVVRLYLGSHPFFCLLAGGLWSVATIVLLGLVRREDLAVLTPSTEPVAMATEEA